MNTNVNHDSALMMVIPRPEDRDSMPSMNASDFISAFGLDNLDIQTIDIYHEYDHIYIDIMLNKKPHRCPLCGSVTSKIKAYHLKKIKHSVLNHFPCTINYNARRYVCPTCGKTFYENNPFTNCRTNLSTATVYNVLKELRYPQITFTYVAEKYHLSASTVANLFDQHIKIKRAQLPECISFDETYAFKSKQYNSEYICVLLDYTNKSIVDILPSRRKSYLFDYFYNIDRKEREMVKYVSFDMWETYRIVAKHMFPNCVCIVDKFHVLQELSRKLTRVRVRVMNEQKAILDTLTKKRKDLKSLDSDLSPDDICRYKKADEAYYLLKKFNWVMFSSNPAISDPNIEKKKNRKLNAYLNLNDIYHRITDIDKKLEEACNLHDMMHDFYRNCDHDHAKEELEGIISLFTSSNVKEMVEFSNTLRHWKKEIINSFIIIKTINGRMNNALIENRNKSIKLLKHSSNGYTNWERFRNRVLYCLNGDIVMRG